VHEAGDAIRMRGGQQQSDDPAGRLADPMHLLEPKPVEHRDDLRADRLHGIAIPGRRLVRQTAA
jgi:hypothetical protein